MFAAGSLKESHGGSDFFQPVPREDEASTDELLSIDAIRSTKTRGPYNGQDMRPSTFLGLNKTGRMLVQ